MLSQFWKALKSLLYRKANLLYRVLPARFVLKLYAYTAYALRSITWQLACKYYGAGVTKLRGDIEDFIISNIETGSTVLDVGCAEGNLTRVIARKARAVVGIDLDEAYIQGIDKKEDGFKNVTFIRADILNTEFKDIFDTVVLVHAIEHLDDSARVLEKLSRTARKIILETPGCEQDWITELLKDLGFEAIGDDKHVKLYSELSLRKELEANGWRDISVSMAPTVVRAVARSKSF